MTVAQKYLHEIIDYGGEPFIRAQAILHMQSVGLTQPEIDRWLQGYELAQRLRERRERITPVSSWCPAEAPAARGNSALRTRNADSLRK